ncbi:MAG TPA: circadian clock KaiB family protein [Mucilaginibacter sp.]|jgi:KaiB domain.
MSNDQFDLYLRPANDGHYELKLFVAGSSPASVRAINNLRDILEQRLHNRYGLDIIDIHQQPELAKVENITAVPVLLKKRPIPRRLLVGDMSDTQKVLRGLGLANEPEA